MTGNERKIKRRVQLIVASSMAVFFCLLLTLVVQLAIRANQKNMENSLLNTQAYLQEQLKSGDKMIDFINSPKFIEEYALRELGWGKPGSGIFK